MMMMMMNCFCEIVDRRKTFSIISSRNHCQIFSASQISDTPQAWFEPAWNPSSSFFEWSCVVVITSALTIGGRPLRRKAADIQDEKQFVNLWIFMLKIRHNLWHNFSINCEITFLWNTERNLALLFILQIYLVTAKPVNSWHLRFLKKVSAITRCSLYRVLEILGKKRSQELRWMIFHTIWLNSVNKIYFKI